MTLVVVVNETTTNTGVSIRVMTEQTRVASCDSIESVTSIQTEGNTCHSIVAQSHCGVCDQNSNGFVFGIIDSINGQTNLGVPGICTCDELASTYVLNVVGLARLNLCSINFLKRGSCGLCPLCESTCAHEHCACKRN